MKSIYFIYIVLLLVMFYVPALPAQDTQGINTPETLHITAKYDQAQFDSINKNQLQFAIIASRIDSIRVVINDERQYNIDGMNNLLLIAVLFSSIILLICILFFYFKSQIKILAYRKVNMDNDMDELPIIIGAVKQLKEDISQLRDKLIRIEDKLMAYHEKEQEIIVEKTEEKQPEVEKPLSLVFYSASPEPNGLFVEKNLILSKPHDALYKITLEKPTAMQGILELVLDDPNVVKRAINAVSYYLAPACDYYLEINRISNGIKQKDIGLVQKKEKDWQVIDKVKISFE